MEEEIAPHVDEIIRALGTANIDQAIILTELEKLLEFKVPLVEAKRSLLKKYGVGDIPEAKTLAELRGGERNIQVTARILDVNLKVVGIKGQERTIYMGTMADETGTRNFTGWDDFDLKVGDVIKVSNAYTRIWQGMPEINFGPRSSVEKMDPNTLDQQKIQDLSKPVVLADLKGGTPAVNTIFRIVESREQQINTRNGPMTIISGIAADASAKLPFTSWVPGPELTPGNTVAVENAYMKSWRGVPSINISEKTTIHIADEPISETDIERILEPDPVRLNRILERDGAFDVSIEGSIISIRPGSGLISRCPKCSRVIQKETCRVHGTVEGTDDLRIKSILDDGTGALTVVLDADLTQKVTGFSIDKAREVAAAAQNPSAVEEEIARKLLGRIMLIRGNMTKGEYGVTLVASDARLSELENTAAAAALIQKLEGAA